MEEVIDKVEDEQRFLKQESKPLQIPPPTTTTSPPSASSSPTHEFSFTVSLHPQPPPQTTTHHHYNPNNTNNNYKTNSTTNTFQPPPAAIDLSPADDIFYGGQLLPLNPLSLNLPDSPRSSTNSIDRFTLPINLLYHQSNPIGNTSFHCHHQTTFSDSDSDVEPDVITTNHNPPKSKSFSIFKWKKRYDDERERDDPELYQTKERNTKKLKLDLGQLIKRYMKMVRPLLSFPKSRRANRTFNTHQSYSFSSKPVERINNKLLGGNRRGQFSAPASMRASPANSGVLVASGCVSPTKSTSESTMEELHAAIQAAIAHCKNSIAMEDKNIQTQCS